MIGEAGMPESLFLGAARSYCTVLRGLTPFTGAAALLGMMELVVSFQTDGATLRSPWAEESSPSY
jgi:hypothetical protein